MFSEPGPRRRLVPLPPFAHPTFTTAKLLRYRTDSLPSAQQVWVDMLRGARQTVDLEHFYLSRKPGEALDPVLDELGRAASCHGGHDGIGVGAEPAQVDHRTPRLVPHRGAPPARFGQRPPAPG